MTSFSLLLLFLVSRAQAMETTSAIEFGEKLYTYNQTISGVPACPEVLDTLYSLDTMRALTRYVDTITMLGKSPTTQVVRIEFGVLGIRGALIYDRVIDRVANGITIRLLAYENNVSMLPFPDSFVAQYWVTHDEEGTQVVYTQEALTENRISLFYQLYVKNQMRRFENTLNGIVSGCCP